MPPSDREVHFYFDSPPSDLTEGNGSTRQSVGVNKTVPRTHFVSASGFLKRSGCRNGSAVRERVGGPRVKETPAVSKEWTCVFRGQEHVRRVFVGFHFLTERTRMIFSRIGETYRYVNHNC